MTVRIRIDTTSYAQPLFIAAATGQIEIQIGAGTGVVLTAQDALAVADALRSIAISAGAK